jgi:hypothetical protein
MNYWKRKSRLPLFASTLGATVLMIAATAGITNSIADAAGKGLDVEVPYEIKAL